MNENIESLGPPFIQNPFLNKVFCENVLKFTPTLPDECIDIVITSCPYNVDLEGYDDYDDNKDHVIYIRWLKRIFKQIYPKLRKGGRIAIVVGDGKNGRKPTHIDISNFMIHQLGYLPMSTIIWNKRNTSNRTAWGSFMSPSEPSLPTPFEYILVFAKESYKLQWRGETDIKKEEFVEWSLAHWTLDRQAYQKSNYIINNKIHPAPFPEEIPTRLIKLFSWVGATVYDPFVGSGTTAIAASKCGRNYIVADKSKGCCNITKKRLKETIVSYSFFEDEE